MPMSSLTFWPSIFVLGFVSHRVSHHPTEIPGHDPGIFPGSQEVAEVFSLAADAVEPIEPDVAVVPFAALPAEGASEEDTVDLELHADAQARCLRSRLAPTAAALLRWLEEDCTKASGPLSATAASGLLVLLALADIAVAVKMSWSLVRWLTHPAKRVKETPKEPNRLPPRPQFFEIHSEGEDDGTPRRPKKAKELEAARLKLAEQEKELLQQRAVASSLQEELTQQKLAAAALQEELLQLRVRTRAAQSEATQTDAEAVLEAELQVSRKELSEVQMENLSLRASLEDRANEKKALLQELADQKASMAELAAKTQKKLVAAAEEKRDLRRELDLMKSPTKKPSSWW
ncbi:unnamed protein product [Symbiodinium sp. CCMP2592]|nr:unnamed protein product [Symbiodinium sp. CCMP2592]